MLRAVAIVPVVLVFALAGCAVGPRAELAPSSVAPSSAVPSVEPSVDYGSLPVELPGNGSFVAGVDMRPGVWFEETPAPNCQWFLGTDGELDASGEGDFIVDSGQTVEVSACSVFVWQQYED